MRQSKPLPFVCQSQDAAEQVWLCADALLRFREHSANSVTDDEHIALLFRRWSS